MLTRCPGCATHFRVTAEQLKARAGRVRCGECQHVFNALDTLIEEPVMVVAAAGTVPAAAFPVPSEPARAADVRPEAASETAVPPAPTADLPITAAAEQEVSADGVPPGPPFDIALPEVSPESTETVTAPRNDVASTLDPLLIPLQDAAHAVDQPQQSEPGPPSELDDAWGEPAPRRWPWVLGCILAFLAIAIQAAFAFRVELAVVWPQARPALVAACELAGCELGLPAKVGLVGIESSDLHPDGSQKGRLALLASLKNRAPFAQAYPLLELTLTDTADKAIVRKVLAPVDYLPRTTSIAAGMPPGAEIAINIALDAGELPASGYRLYIFYP